MSGAERIECSAVRSPSNRKVDTNMLERAYMAVTSKLEGLIEPNSNAVSGIDVHRMKRLIGYMLKFNTCSKVP